MSHDSPKHPQEVDESSLLAYLRRPDYEPVAQRQLLHRLHLAPRERPRVRRLIRRLIDAGQIVKIRGGKLAPRQRPETLTGMLHRHRDGYGFVAVDGEDEDVFVAPPDLGEGLTGDRVAVRVTGRGRGKRLQGTIVETVERRSRRVLGVFSGRGPDGVVQPFDPGLSDAIHVPADARGGARHREVVELEILRDPGSGQSGRGKVLARHGRLDDPGADVMVVTHKYGLDAELSAEVLKAASRLPSRVRPRDRAERTRFDDPPPLTIDGATAQDFDDAIAVAERPRGGFRLFVHIADVAHFVTAGGVLDREARRRGTSVYFPDRVLPMFPEKLSNDLCSLRPGVDRLVHSVILDIDDSGAVTQTRFADGVIRSAARLTYSQVAAVLSGEKRVRGVPAKVVPMLQAAGRLRRALERRRQERGSVDFDLPEPQILLDVEGAVTGITIEPRNEAHRLIEECMLAANEAVAGHLEQRRWPCLFRVHDLPDPAKVGVLADFVRNFGLELRQADPREIAPGDIRRLIEQLEGRPEYRVVSQVALRSMRQARYATENTGHFGLAAPTYCHFTSPIRRYPDLVNHRLLRAARRRRPGEVAGTVEQLEAIAESSSELERNAEAAERELLNWKKIALIRDRVGERFEGLITGVAPFGMFVQLTENLVEGLLRSERLGDERFVFDERRQQLRGEGSGRRYRLGDRVQIVVERVDRVLQRVEFSLAQAAAGDRRGAGRRVKKRRNRK